MQRDGRWFVGRDRTWPLDEPSEGDAILGAARRARPPSVRAAEAVPPASDKGTQRNQLLLAVVASLGYMTVGLVRGFSSPGVPSMRQLDPHLLEAAGAVSWISSIPPLGACVGSLVAGPLLQRVGRRRTLLLSAPVAVGAWTGLALAQSYPALLAARIVTGFCAGVIIPSAQVYVSECSRPSARGVLGSLPALFMSAGILVGYVMGALVPWRWLAGASALCPAALGALLLPLPESPTWLTARGRAADAATALRWLRRPSPDTPALPLQQMGAGDKEAAADSGAGGSGVGARALLQRSVLVPFGLALALMVFQQLSGIDAVIFYTVEIFEAAGGGVPEHVAAAAVGAVQLAANAVALLAVDRAGRRPLLVASGAISAVAMAALGAYFHLHALGRADGLGALPLASLIVFMIGFSVGLCTLPYLMMSEMLPAAQRGALSSAAGSFNLGVMFIVIKTFHDLSGAVGEAGAFWVYAALCTASCIFVLLFIPETKGRSLEEIQAHFEGRSGSRKKAADAEGGAAELSSKMASLSERRKTPCADGGAPGGNAHAQESSKSTAKRADKREAHGEDPSASDGGEESASEREETTLRKTSSKDETTGASDAEDVEGRAETSEKDRPHK